MNKLLKRIISTMMSMVLILSVIGAFPVDVKAEETESSDSVYFGRYMQTEVTDAAEIEIIKAYGFEDGKLSVGGVNYAQAHGKYYKETPIEWKVIKDDGEYYTLLSKDVLLLSNFGWMDCWNVSYLRAWLNEEFFYNAFTSDERQDIPVTQVVTTKVPFYAPGAAGSGEPYDVITEDRVYLLSLDEALDAGYGFSSTTDADESRMAYTTPYMSDTPGNCEWWLRGEGRWSYGNFQGSYIEENGSVGYWYQTYSKGVRPVIRVRKDSSLLYTECPIVTVSTEMVDSNLDVLNSVSKLFSIQSNSGDTIKGPAFNLMGNTVNLFQVDFQFSSPLFFKKSEICVKYDEETRVAEVLVGYDDKAKMDLDSSSKDSDKWKNSWEATKSIVLGLTERGKFKIEYERPDENPMEKYKEIKKQLAEKKMNIGLNASANVVGFFKVQLDEKLNPVSVLEGGVVVDASIGASFRHYFYGAIYSEFTGTGAFEGKFLGKLSEGRLQPVAEMEIKYIPSVAIGANLIAVDVQGGIQGELSTGIKLPWKSPQQSMEVKLKGSAFVKISSLIGLSAEYEHEFKNYVSLYPEFGLEESSLEMQFEDEHYLSPAQINQLEAIDENSIDDSVIESLVDNHAKPNAEELPDGTVLLTYLSDKQEQSLGQQTLMYRVNTNGTWSDEAAVYQTDCMETAAEVFVFNDDAYVIYERSAAPFTESMSATDAAASMELYVAKYNKDTKSFSEPVKISAANDTYKYEYQLCTIGGKLTAMWAENSEKDVMLSSGTTKVYTSTLENEVWAEAVEYKSTNSVISEMLYGFHGPSEKYIHQVGRDLYVGNKRYTADKTLENFTYANGKLYYLNHTGELRYIGGYFEYSKSTGIYTTSEYIIDGENGVYWVEGENFNSNIFFQSFEEGSTPLQVTYEDGYIESFDLCEINGENTLIYTLQAVDENAEDIYGGTILKASTDFEHARAEISSVAYDAKTFAAGAENGFYIEALNSGTVALTNLKAQFMDASGEIFAIADICEVLEAGESAATDVTVAVPAELKEGTINVKLVATEALEEVAPYELSIASADYDISLSEKNVFALEISNNGSKEAKDVVLEIRDKGISGDVIFTETIESIAPGETVSISITDVYENAYSYSDIGYILNCVVTQSDEEINMLDNGIVVQKRYDEGIYGDVNSDGTINAQDALMVLKYAAKINSFYSPVQFSCAEVDGNEGINAQDALFILKYASKLIDKFPVDE